MKVCILAGGRGTRLGPDCPPKPLLPVGGKPLLWHVMQLYASRGFDDFRIALGYEAARIARGLRAASEPAWHLDLRDTGIATDTGGRVAQLMRDIEDSCFLTWADGLSDVDIDALLAFHRSHGRLATLTSVRPPQRFGYLELDGERVTRFAEKRCPVELWINGAFFVLEPGVRAFLGDSFERDCLPRLAAAGELMAFRHEGFWQCADTVAEWQLLQRLWQRGAPWLPGLPIPQGG